MFFLPFHSPPQKEEKRVPTILDYGNEDRARGRFRPDYAKPHSGGSFFSSGQAHRQGYGFVPGGYGPYDAYGGYISPGEEAFLYICQKYNFPPFFLSAKKALLRLRIRPLLSDPSPPKTSYPLPSHPHPTASSKL